MIKSDRVFGLVVVIGALWYIWSALQIQASFMSDPVGSKTFPILLGAVAILCGLIEYAYYPPCVIDLNRTCSLIGLK